MKTHVRITLLIAVLVIFACFGFLSLAQNRTTSIAVPPPTTGPDMPVFLNGKPAGSTANLEELKTNLAAIYLGHQQRSPVFTNAADGSLPITDRVIFVPDEQLSMLQFGSVARTVQDSFDFYSSRQLVVYGSSGCPGSSKADAANIVLSNSALIDNRNNGTCWLEISVPKSSSRLTKRYRVAMTSIEVNADGSYLLNDQLANLPPLASPNANWSVSSNRMIDAVKIKQRPIDTASLDKEVVAWVNQRIAENNKDWQKIDAQIAKEYGASGVADHGPVELPIIVNGKSLYSSIVPILRSVPRGKFELVIVVNNSAQ